VTDGLRAITIIVVAVALDFAVGDPPNRWHPVAWLGHLLRAVSSRVMHGSPQRLFVTGGTVVLAVAVFAWAMALVVIKTGSYLGWAGLLLEAVAFKSLLALRGLVTAARTVARDLERGNLSAARVQVGFHLVSRPTAGLDNGHVASAAIESVAENLTDSFIGPLCCYLAFGLPGAAVYRVVNTADAMLGYRDGRLEYFGKVAARLDDAVNLIPARLAGLALVVGAAFAGDHIRSAFAAMARDAARTASPNAGWTIAAMAGALRVTLEKPRAYRLGRGALPSAPDIERGIRVMLAAAMCALAASLILRYAVSRYS
jgi:adenosylcobinamide-phosphate synthase